MEYFDGLKRGKCSVYYTRLPGIEFHPWQLLLFTLGYSVLSSITNSYRLQGYGCARKVIVVFGGGQKSFHEDTRGQKPKDLQTQYFKIGSSDGHLATCWYRKALSFAPAPYRMKKKIKITLEKDYFRQGIIELTDSMVLNVDELIKKNLQ